MSMDRIRSAIEKARDARERLAEDGIGVAPRPVTTKASDALALARLWAGLEELHPSPRVIDRHKLVSIIGGGPAIAFDMMRTKVLQQMRANNLRRLAITSPSSECGKTMTCLNLGFSLGRQPDVRTIIIEADLRRPAMALTLGMPQRHMFSTVLEGTAQPSQHMVRYGPNLAFGTNCAPVRNPAELLQGPAVGPVLAAVEQQFAPDLMIFDMPPMQAGDDTMGFLGQVDCVLLVAAAGKTTVAQVDACERELASLTNVMGVVLTKCRYLDKTQSYDAEYHN